MEHLEEKLRLMTEARDEAQNCCLKQKQMVGEAQVKANQLNLHADGLRRRIEELQQVISSGLGGGGGGEGGGAEQIAEVVWLIVDLSLCVRT